MIRRLTVVLVSLLVAMGMWASPVAAAASSPPTILPRSFFTVTCPASHYLPPRGRFGYCFLQR